jgi:hypothetical protein
VSDLTDPHKSFWSLTIQAVGPSLLADGILAEDDFRKVLRAMRAAHADPGVMVAGYRNHQLIARRPG